MLDIYWNLIIPLAIILAFNIAIFVLVRLKVLQRLKLTRNFIVVLLVVTLVPIICIGFTNTKKTSSLIFTEMCEKLQSIGKTRALFVNERLEEAKNDAETIANHWIVQEVLRLISVEKTDRADTNFATIYKNALGHLSRIAQTGGFEDIMLVSATGKIELTSAKYAVEVGTDISEEIYFKQGKAQTYFTDLFYHTLSKKNLMYITTPCCDQQGQFLGCVIVEMDIKRVYNVLSDREGLEESAETYIVNKDKLMVSESRFIRDAILKTRVDTRGVNEGLAGGRGVAMYPDYRNVSVIGAWFPIQYTNWVLLAEVDKDDAFQLIWHDIRNEVILVSAIVVMAVVIAVFSARATVRPVQELIAVAEQVGKGDFSKEVNVQSHDEIGALINVFNYMLESLRSLIKQTQESILRISTVTVEMLSSSEEQASSSSELAASVGEITATAEELSSSAKQIATNAESVAKVADDTDTTGQQGLESITASIHIMEEIKAVTKDSAGKILTLSEKSQKIGDVLELIKEIAGETHLLALNASIEASAAGEFGKRFGVVATEVRRLAERTKASAEEIKGIITEIQASTNAAVLTTEQGVKNVEKGVEVMQRVGQSIEAISNLIAKTAEASQQIVMATHQQKSATEQVAGTMREISEVVKQTSAGLKQTTAAIAELNKLADDFKEAVKKYKT